MSQVRKRTGRLAENYPTTIVCKKVVKEDKTVSFVFSPEPPELSPESQDAVKRILNSKPFYLSEKRCATSVMTWIIDRFLMKQYIRSNAW